ncbi:MAG: TPM domain-containing protein [Gemmataceae bacterium]|nr:TPM domain-containing protein [Gemmataceae bacterium]
MLLLCLFLAGPVSKTTAPDPKPTGPVIDRLFLFGKHATARAAHDLADLKARHKRGLVLETVADDPDLKKAQALKEDARERALDAWALKRAKAANVGNGLYVAITGSPRAVRVVGLAGEGEDVFPPERRDALRDDIRSELRENPDKALSVAVKRFGEMLDDLKITGPVLDRLRLFTASAIARQAERLKALREEHEGWQLIIETTRKQADMSHLKGWFNGAERERAITAWAREKAQEAGLVKGLYVVITQEPRDVRVVAWPDNAELTFPPYMRQRLREDMRPGLKTQPSDGALGAAVDRFEELLRRVKQHGNPLETVPLLAVLGGLVGGWLVLFIVRRRHGGPALYPPAMLGGVFGSPAGMWINDQLFDTEAPPPVQETKEP